MGISTQKKMAVGIIPTVTLTKHFMTWRNTDKPTTTATKEEKM